jgi:hypothetical protein
MHRRGPSVCAFPLQNCFIITRISLRPILILSSHLFLHEDHILWNYLWLIERNWGSWVSTVTRSWAGRPRFSSRQGQWCEFVLFATASRPALTPVQLPIKWVARVLPQGVRRPELEADHIPSIFAEVKNVLSYTSASAIRLHGVVLS